MDQGFGNERAKQVIGPPIHPIDERGSEEQRKLAREVQQSFVEGRRPWGKIMVRTVIAIAAVSVIAIGVLTLNRPAPTKSAGNASAQSPQAKATTSTPAAPATPAAAPAPAPQPLALALDSQSQELAQKIEAQRKEIELASAASMASVTEIQAKAKREQELLAEGERQLAELRANQAALKQVSRRLDDIHAVNEASIRTVSEASEAAQKVLKQLTAPTLAKVSLAVPQATAPAATLAPEPPAKPQPQRQRKTVKPTEDSTIKFSPSKVLVIS